MPVHGFNHYNLRASRPLLDRLRDFYCTVVGLELGPRPAFRSFGYWLYAGGRDVLHLSEAGDTEVRHSHVPTTFDHVAFTCTGYAAMIQHLENHGVEFGRREVAATGVRQIFFQDPAGNGVEFNFSADEAVL